MLRAYKIGTSPHKTSPSHGNDWNQLLDILAEFANFNWIAFHFPFSKEPHNIFFLALFWSSLFVSFVIHKSNICRCKRKIFAEFFFINCLLKWVQLNRCIGICLRVVHWICVRWMCNCNVHCLSISGKQKIFILVFSVNSYFLTISVLQIAGFFFLSFLVFHLLVTKNQPNSLSHRHTHIYNSLALSICKSGMEQTAIEPICDYRFH